MCCFLYMLSVCDGQTNVLGKMRKTNVVGRVKVNECLRNIIEGLTGTLQMINTDF